MLDYFHAFLQTCDGAAVIVAGTGARKAMSWPQEVLKLIKEQPFACSSEFGCVPA